MARDDPGGARVRLAWGRPLAATAVLAAVAAVVAITAAATRQVLLGPEREEREGREVRGSMRSTVLGEDREVVVLLPEGYARDVSRTYPALYVLDGDSQLAHTASSAALLARIGAMPEVIVVSAPPVDARGRMRDYTPPGMSQDSEGRAEGRADRFLLFLRDELIPRIEREYRVARPRLLAGNSRGGLFVVYSLLAMPSLFDARFAFSPALWRDGESMVARLDRFLAAPPSPPPSSFLYLSLGDQENEKMKAAFERTRAVLAQRGPGTLLFRGDLTLGGRHGDNAYLSTPVGLHAFFSRKAGER